MSRSGSSSTTKRKTVVRPKPVQGSFWLLPMVLSGVALIDYNSSQHPNPSMAGATPESNIIGLVGEYLGAYSLLIIGLTAFLLPLLFFWAAYVCFSGRGKIFQLKKGIAIALLFLSGAVLASLIQGEMLVRDEPSDSPPITHEDLQGSVDYGISNYLVHGAGGIVGQTIYHRFFLELLNWVGTAIVFGMLFGTGLGLLLHDNALRAATLSVQTWPNRWKASRLKAKEKAEARRIERDKKKQERAKAKKEEAARREKEQKAAEAKAAREAKAAAKAAPATPEEPAPFETVDAPPPKRKPVEPETPLAPIPFTPIVEGPDDVPSGMAVDLAEAEPASAEPAPKKRLKPRENAQPSFADSGLKIVASEATRKANVQLPEKRGDYIFPPMKLLSEPMHSGGDDAASYEETAQTLVQTLEEFGVKVTMGEVHTGPVITRFDVFPAPGVRVEKIVNLDKNIALGLKALSVRILAPVPGKGCVGIEVPNKNRSAVVIRDILESEDWVSTKADIPIALGKEVSGKPLVADLTKMPHLLIAGSTGSGKTVCINAIITSLLYHSSPEDVRFVMVDPKIVEMQVYNALPHMLIPVVTDPKKVPNALKYLLGEMERRYQTFAKVGVRNIAGYNAKMAKNKAEAAEAEAKAAELDAALSPEERAAAATAIEVPRELNFDEEELPTKLPYIVCIVDELADLMMVAPADIETGIARLAQLARAAGIHLILATQRPSVNVITGVIKANLPSRIAFKVASKVDSRTILDAMGADQLIGKGDMLFLPPGSADLLRSQGAFVDDDEIAGIVQYIAEENGEPTFDETFQRSVEEGGDDGGPSAEGEYDDEMVPQAIEVIRSSKRASTSMLQRRLKIGYNRAARIMEILEDEGMVGPENGSSPREILFDVD